ncbi:MAG: hypothetical protein LC749_16430, partial [Actinobacteria bacterium]|nr:hypothetical protein [Actinomycetota bacterium]
MAQLRRQRFDQLIALREPLQQLLNRRRSRHCEIINATDSKIKTPRRARGPDQLLEKKFAFGIEGPCSGGHLKADYENLSFETIAGDTEILPGVTLLQTPGHTPG